MFETVSNKRLTKAEAKKLFGLEKEFGLWQCDDPDLCFKRLPSLRDLMIRAYELGSAEGQLQVRRHLHKVLGV